MKIDNSPVRGTRDLLPAAVAVRDHVLSAITEVYRRFGYQRIETPALEDIARLRGGQGGENEKLIYQVLRRGLSEVVDEGTQVSDLVDLGLRFDLTVPLTRFYGQHHDRLPLPFRSLQFGPVWRAERPQKGRYRQFYQCDIDMVGEQSVLAEAELIEATTAALAAVGLADVTIRLSDRRLLTALAVAADVSAQEQGGFFITLDKLDKIGWDGVREELRSRGLPDAAIEATFERIRSLQGIAPGKVADRLSDTVPGLGDDVVEDMAAVAAALDRVGRDRELRWEFDPTLVRGMGYYTGQIFEIAHTSTASSLGGGGRYDKLIGRSLGREVPACGFSIGFERILDLLTDIPRPDSLAVLVEPEVAAADALALARRYRADDRVVSVVRRSGKLGAQLKRLEEWGITSFVHVRAGEESSTELDERPTARLPN